MLVLFSVSRINYQTSESRRGDECPRVAFSGRQVDALLEYRIGFGQYAQCTVANTDRSMSARTEDCIAMLPTGNRTGSVKMMSIGTGKLVTRDQFIIHCSAKGNRPPGKYCRAQPRRAERVYQSGGGRSGNLRQTRGSVAPGTWFEDSGWLLRDR